MSLFMRDLVKEDVELREDKALAVMAEEALIRKERCSMKRSGENELFRHQRIVYREASKRS